MQPITTLVFCAIALVLVSCGGADDATPAVTVGPAPVEVIEITTPDQFDAEIAKARPGAVVVVDFHAEWCGPCKKLGPELVALAAANPGKLYVLKIDIDQQPKLAERFLVESIPLLVKFTDGKESERTVGYGGKDKLVTWLGIR